MNGHILCGDTILKLPSARIAKQDVNAFHSCADLFERAKATRDSTEQIAQEAKQAGYEQGQQKAFEEMREALSQALDNLTQAFADENAKRERDTAKAAMQVVGQVIGQTEDAEVIAGIARQALSRLASDEVKVTVAPEWADELRVRLDDIDGLSVQANPSLDRFACRINLRDGQVIADLDTQLASLRKRWGIDAVSPDA